MANRAATIGSSDSPSGWYKELPPITKFFLTGTLVTGFCATFGIFPASVGGANCLLFNWELIRHKFHIWRLVTPFIFAGGFGLNFVFHMFILYENCKRYEANPFNTGAGGTSADMLYMVITGAVVLMILEITLGFGLPMMSEPMLYMIIYVWSRKDPEQIISIWGFKFKALYLPWVYMCIRVLMTGQVPVTILIGIVVGHLYYFLVDVVPGQHGYTVVKTPVFCSTFLEWITNVSQGAARPAVQAYPPNANAAAAAAGAGAGADGIPRQRFGGGGGGGGGYAWGRGNVLGGVQ